MKIKNKSIGKNRNDQTFDHPCIKAIFRKMQREFIVNMHNRKHHRESQDVLSIEI